MGETPVTVPVVIEDEEQAVVNRFIQGSRDIAPSVQVSLAKRIIRPGSNRLVCLAAHTSIPLNDDEMASVSNLALRLSDGTNVRMSLSFFDDNTTANEIVPLSRCIYDPNKYEAPRKSNFGLVWAGLALTALASFCFFLNAPQTPHSVVQSPVKYLTTDHSAKTDRPQATTKSKKSIALAPRTTVADFEHTLARAPHKPTAQAKAVRTGDIRTMYRKKERYVPSTMFVPPPPPTAYSPVFPVAPAGFDPLQMMSPLSAPSKTPVVSSKPAVTRWLPKAEAQTTPAIAKGSAAESPVKPTVIPAKTDDAPAVALERIVPPPAGASSGAPLPGGN